MGKGHPVGCKDLVIEDPPFIPREVERLAGVLFYRFRLDHLRLFGWRLFAPAEYVNWCGHRQEFIPWPDPDGWVRLVPIVGEAV